MTHPSYLYPCTAPCPRATRVAPFLQVNVNLAPGPQALTKRLESMLSLESLNPQWGRQERITIIISFFVDEETEAHTSHLLVWIKNILWCKLIQLFHYLVAVSPKSLSPSGNLEGALPRGPKLEIKEDSKSREVRGEPWPMSKNFPHWWLESFS